MTSKKPLFDTRITTLSLM